METPSCNHRAAVSDPAHVPLETDPGVIRPVRIRPNIPPSTERSKPLHLNRHSSTWEKRSFPTPGKSPEKRDTWFRLKLGGGHGGHYRRCFSPPLSPALTIFYKSMRNYGNGTKFTSVHRRLVDKAGHLVSTIPSFVRFAFFSFVKSVKVGYAVPVAGDTDTRRTRTHAPEVIEETGRSRSPSGTQALVKRDKRADGFIRGRERSPFMASRSGAPRCGR